MFIKRTTVRLPEELSCSLASIAKSKGKSRNDIIIEACYLYRRGYERFGGKAYFSDCDIEARLSAVEARLAAAEKTESLF